MADSDKDTKDTGNESGGITMADIRKIVQDTVQEVTKDIGGAKDKAKDTEETAHDGAEKHTQSRLDRSSAMEEAVRSEIDRIKRKEAREARDKTIDEELAKLSEATKEKPPVERRRVHKIMGWGENV